jgi:DNA-binding NarL/FixJ family response regulator
MSTVLVEDDAATRAYLLDALNQCAPLLPVTAATSVATGLAALQMHRPKLLLVDLGLPDGEGTQLILAASKMDPRPEVLVISSLGDETHVIRALEAGASGYLLKDESPAAIGQAALKVLEGESPISPAIAVHLLKRFRAQSAVPAAPEIQPHPLSDREVDILKLIAKGLRHDEVAETLGLRYSTVVSYVRDIYRKLAVHSRTEALFEARQLGLLRE